MKEITKPIGDETKEQKGGFLRILLGTLRARLLENMLIGKRILRLIMEIKKEKEC